MYFPSLIPRILSHRMVMYTPTGPQRYTPSSLSPHESSSHATPMSEYSQSSHGSPSGVYADRPGSRASQASENLPPFNPYYCQHQGPGVNTGTHPHNLAHILRHVPPYPTSGDSAYTWQGDGPGGGYRTLYSPQTCPGWLSGSFPDQATESLHVSMAQIIAEVKGLAARVTSQSEGEAERNERLDRLLTRVEGIEAQMTELGGAISGGTDVCARRLSRGSKSVSNEHPLLKVCQDTISHVPSVLKISARGPHDLFSDVWSGEIGEQREMY